MRIRCWDVSTSGTSRSNGQRLGLREVQDGRLVTRPEQHLLIEAPGVLGTRRNYQDGRLEERGGPWASARRGRPPTAPAAGSRTGCGQAPTIGAEIPASPPAARQVHRATFSTSKPKGRARAGLACWRCYLSTRYGSGEYPQGVEGAGHVRDVHIFGALHVSDDRVGQGRGRRLV